MKENGLNSLSMRGPVAGNARESLVCCSLILMLFQKHKGSSFSHSMGNIDGKQNVPHILEAQKGLLLYGEELWVSKCCQSSVLHKVLPM